MLVSTAVHLYAVQYIFHENYVQLHNLVVLRFVMATHCNLFRDFCDTFIRITNSAVPLKYGQFSPNSSQ